VCSTPEAELGTVANAEVRRLNADIYAAYARRLACELDEARNPAGLPDDTDETIDRPPATADDDPAPAESERSLEAWNPAWDEAPSRPGVNGLVDLLSA
jgi:hypothetical protein